MLVINDSDKPFKYCYGGVEKIVPPKDGGTWSVGTKNSQIEYTKISDDPPAVGVHISPAEWSYLNKGSFRNAHSLTLAKDMMTDVTNQLSELQLEKERLAKENEDFKARLALYSDDKPSKPTSKAKK
ncbi:hypothetical protein CMI37_23195 [Candidatus Pacearchaeota archaeon]|nr:hypothetical protein [Candidatus Pacearchaeota archaeon]|tara:strand:+ start:469 stop:849 length:381 start_codon:yes stop_codon:yes gene_type:complete